MNGEANAMNGPDPSEKHPMAGFPQVGFLKNLVTRPNILVGDYTYYDDPEGPERFEQNVLYHYPFIGDRLVIGKFCAIAKDVKFIMNGANHRLSGLTTYPFGIFSKGWEAAAPGPGELPYRGDTVVGNDVWIGYEALIMPGVKIGDGAIIASRAVVARHVRPYSVVGGNPAEVLRMRFSPDKVARLSALGWWDWDAAKITRNLKLLVAADVDALEHAQ
jgi:virginiamycin A acetyltransferase